MHFICPFTKARKAVAGERIFTKGEVAEAMFIVESGQFLLSESSLTLAAPAMVGELGLLAPNGVRTQSLVCTEDGAVLPEP